MLSETHFFLYNLCVCVFSQVDKLLSCFHGVFGHCSVMFYDFEAYEATFHGICGNTTCKYGVFLHFLVLRLDRIMNSKCLTHTSMYV